MAVQEDQMTTDEEGLPANRLTKTEIRELRDLLESDRRARWAWSTGRIWATWVTGTIVAVYTIWDTVEKLVKRMAG